MCNNTGYSAGNWDTTDESDNPHISRLETTSRKRNQKQNESQPQERRKKTGHHDDNRHMKMALGELRELMVEG
jgi:hypothetical protein